MTKAVELAQVASTGVSEAFKNRWINGSMVINQRGGTTTVDGTEVYGLDRWKGADATSGVFTMQQSSDAPAGSGFKYSLLATVTTADTSISAGEYAFLRQIIEGFNCADLEWGTANGKTITVSFWVKSNVTGTYSFTVINEAANQSYPTTYTINTANNWEFKTITIPGATAGTWQSTNGIGIYCDFALATGSSYTRTPNAWTSSLALGATGQVNWLATNGNTFYLTGCQFEVGSSATSFEYRPYGTELMLCQRYLFTVRSTGAANGENLGMTGVGTGGVDLYRTNMALPVTMRAAPTISVSNVSGSGTDFRAFNGGAVQSITALGGQFSNVNYLQADWTMGGSYAVGAYVAVLWRDNITNGWLRASAEL